MLYETDEKQGLSPLQRKNKASGKPISDCNLLQHAHHTPIQSDGSESLGPHDSAYNCNTFTSSPQPLNRYGRHYNAFGLIIHSRLRQPAGRLAGHGEFAVDNAKAINVLKLHKPRLRPST